MKYSISIFLFFVIVIILQACSATRYRRSTANQTTEKPVVSNKVNKENSSVPVVVINTRHVPADSIVSFAETLLGVKYKYGSIIKEQGFDCSGFITYTFNHFKIQVPRVSKDFTNAGYPVPLERSKPGDLILFTGTDTTGWVVGHMGMITQNDDGKIKFIHSSSGKSIGVIISPLSKYYETRFVKVIRVFND